MITYLLISSCDNVWSMVLRLIVNLLYRTDSCHKKWNKILVILTVFVRLLISFSLLYFHWFVPGNSVVLNIYTVQDTTCHKIMQITFIYWNWGCYNIWRFISDFNFIRESFTKCIRSWDLVLLHSFAYFGRKKLCGFFFLR